MKCRICGNYIYKSSKHQCPPVWFIEHEDYLGDELAREYAYDIETAATQYGEKYDVDDHPLLDGGSIAITIYDNPDRLNGREFEVTGETVPEYNAIEIVDLTSVIDDLTPVIHNDLTPVIHKDKERIGDDALIQTP